MHTHGFMLTHIHTLSANNNNNIATDTRTQCHLQLVQFVILSIIKMNTNSADTLTYMLQCTYIRAQ